MPRGDPEIRSCACGRWKINAMIYPVPPEGLCDPCPNCGVSQYAFVVHPDGFLVDASPRFEQVRVYGYLREA